MDKTAEIINLLKEEPEKQKKLEKATPEREPEEKFSPNGVQESWGGYVKVRKAPTMPGEEDTGKIIKKPITEFLIEPQKLIVSDEKTELQANIKHGFQKIPIVLTSSDFASPRDFKNAIGKVLGPAAGWFDGKQSELTGIQRIVNAKEIKRLKGVKLSGLHYINKKWLIITSKGGRKNA
ncbi:hypothetical protein RBH29_08590 [Herbivorax sp. ANBcel31]|uniref:hypothetical protein n=1 Tax=Herbivorax sp. ANBcel31 TaxID=3069754 RepID=UPI0027B6DA8C|nr:hypothetical protein [Herbivorax sp. ANBcel31]MDQ2086483.1 hypothetical protein [Herbivorax sp. ANBcel31]